MRPDRRHHEALRACERALVEAARRAGAGSRQRVRAAARRFVRRHRRDRSYLEWVLRCAVTSAAAAAALLGLVAEPAGAKAPHFFETVFPVTGNPLPVDPGVTFGDLDADGDADLLLSLVQTGSSSNRYFENTGTATGASFIERTGSANPLLGQGALGGDFADLDADGDLDLAAVSVTFPPISVIPHYFENTGSATLPAFVERTGVQNPIDGLPVGGPSFGDLDGDGDLDLVSGTYYFENTGDAASPTFVQRTGAANPVGSLPGGAFFLRLADLDRDADIDLVGSTGTFPVAQLYYENTGGATSPAFAFRPARANPLERFADAGALPDFADLDGDGDLDALYGDNFVFARNLLRAFPGSDQVDTPGFPDVGNYSIPALGDLDADGDLDIIAGVLEFPGPFFYLRNTGSATSPAFVSVTGSANPTFPINVNGHATSPTLGDLDADGDLDLISGDYRGLFYSLRNSGTPTAPAFSLEADPANQIDTFDVGDHSTPALADLDGDNDLDLMVGATSGLLFYFQNTGTPAAAVFVARTGSLNPLDGVDVGDHSNPYFSDLDLDGDLDVVVGNFVGTLSWFENSGTRTAPAFVPRSGTANPLDGDHAFQLSAPSFGDLDGDGDPDLVMGEWYGGFRYFENAVVRPAHPRVVPAAGPLAGQDVGSLSAAAAGDFDADGDFDYVASAGGIGALRFFEQVGQPGDPCQELIGPANPFDGFNAGAAPRLAVADVDGDADLDLVSGDSGGPMRFFENVGFPGDPIYEQRTGAANPFAGVIETNSAPTFGDVDLDGDVDLVVGDQAGGFSLYENTGDALTPLYVERSGAANPWSAFDAGDLSTPSLFDADLDGDLDLLAGDGALGQFHYFENTGTATTPAYVARSGAANPLDGKDLGTSSAPTAVDLDRDGDADLVSGRQDGGFSTYYLPEPGTPSLFAAGASLLAWLARRRSR